MSKQLLALVFLVGVLVSHSSLAVIEAYPFEDEQLRQRYSQLTAELRCPKCQNQNLADSDAPIAADMRAEIFRQLHDGKSDTQIEDYLIERYGEFVLYRPRLNQHTLVLWFAPAVLLLLVAMVVVAMIRRKARPLAQSQASLSADLEKILSAEESSR